VRWIVSATELPRIRRRCPGCRAPRQFVCSNRFRVNANGRRIDAWLIYNCERCEDRLNAPVLERAPVASIVPARLASLERNDPAVVRAAAFDPAVLGRCGGEVIAPGFAIERTDDGLEVIAVELADPIRVRLDRLLARGLKLSRRAVSERLGRGELSIDPSDRRGPRAVVRSGLRIYTRG
jgi:hypothetical protein